MLSTLFRKAKSRGDIRTVKIYRRDPSISYLLFADDSFFFFKVEERECKMVKHILSTYEATSSQTVNFQRSGIFISSNVSETSRNLVNVILDVLALLDHFIFLRL